MRVLKICFSLVFVVLLGVGVVSPFVGQADDGNNLDFVGIVDSRPTGVTGTWVIGGKSFTATSSTQIEEEHGTLSVGVCAKVEYPSATDLTAIKIESKEPLECSGGGGDALHMQVYGILQSFPAGQTGNWVVDGVTYVADAGTEFNEEHGPFTIGQCVEVKFLPGSNQALEIETEESYKCSGTPVTGFTEIYGVVESFPADLVGAWVVAGTTYTATLDTQFEQVNGPFFVGACVEVKFVGNTKTAVEIGTTTPDDCDGTGGEPAELKFYGVVDTIPVGMVGDWVIEGETFTSTSTTTIKQEHGPLAVGVCAEVEYFISSGDKIATKIGSEEPYKCNGATFTNEVYGTVNSFPTSFFGTWVVDGINYVADPALTELEQSAGAFAVGSCVKVQYFVESGINKATKIETENAGDCSGGAELPGLSKVYATIDSFPPSPFVGTWQIGGVDYEATAVTQFEQDHGAFANGVCVEAKYTASSGVNSLVKVETESAYKCQNSGGVQPEFSGYGVVEVMPPTTDFTGVWQVSGITYTATAGTEFKQEHGFFAVGAFVEVKYVISGTTRLMTSLETHVAPNAGTNTVSGLLTAFDANDKWNDWTIDGKIYKADPVIEVGTNGQVPVAGEPVILNSYQLNGVDYVTVVNMASQTFLPVVSQP